jgi:hypothetical protein
VTTPAVRARGVLIRAGPADYVTPAGRYPWSQLPMRSNL